ncbi:hypothetical protein GQ457_15G024440 [Hibiscus cannabinus]
MASSKFKAFYNHPAGPKTIYMLVSINLCALSSNGIAVFFWAPTFKWAINIANVVDISTKPAETVSYPTQAGSSIIFFPLACSGLIWAKYSTVITPKNWNLFGVSIAMAATASYQISRKLQSEFIKKSSVAEEY